MKNFKLEYRPFPAEAQGVIFGFISSAGSVPRIVIDNTQPEETQKKALRHELAHLVLGHQNADKPIKDIEKEADALAATKTVEQLIQMVNGNFDQWAALEAVQGVKHPPTGRKATWLEPGRTPAFAYRCKGNSMIPTFYDGELVYIEPSQSFRDGQIVAIEIDGGRTLKRAYKVNEGLRLIPDNNEYFPVTVDENKVKIIGIAVARS